MVGACHESFVQVETEERADLPVRPFPKPGPRPGAVAAVNASGGSEPTAEELAGRCQAGCRDSFEQLVSRYEAPIFNFLLQYTRNRHDAEDLTQVTFLKAYRNLHQYKPSFAFAPWLFGIARRTAAGHFRSAKTFEELPPEGEIVEENPANLLAIKDDRNALWELARTLKPKQWEVLWLRYGEGFSVAETARIMNTNSIHVKVLLHRARIQLSKLLRVVAFETGRSTPKQAAKGKAV